MFIYTYTFLATNIATCLMQKAGAPPRFFPLAMKTAHYLRNRWNTREGSTPVEKLLGYRPNLAHLRVWGCRCYLIGVTNGKLVSAKATLAIFVGYDEARNAYLALPEGSQKPVSCRDILFDEGFFPWKEGPETEAKTSFQSHSSLLIPKYNGSASDSEEGDSEEVAEKQFSNPRDCRAVTELSKAVLPSGVVFSPDASSLVSRNALEPSQALSSSGAVLSPDVSSYGPTPKSSLGNLRYQTE